MCALPPLVLSGFISAAEVQALIQNATGMGIEGSASMAARLIRTYDVNGDGVLSLEEMAVAVRSEPALLAAFQWLPL
jgi:Ca2+-binding EF-hand superfamily protein